MKLDPCNWGPQPFRDYTKKIAEAVNANCPINGIGTTVDDASDGRSINVINGGGGGTGSYDEGVFQGIHLGALMEITLPIASPWREIVPEE